MHFNGNEIYILSFTEQISFKIYVKMALRASMILRRCATQLLQTSSCGRLAIHISASSNFHSSKARLFNRNEKGMYTCTLIPGDGVSTKHNGSNKKQTLSSYQNTDILIYIQFHILRSAQI